MSNDGTILEPSPSDAAAAIKAEFRAEGYTPPDYNGVNPLYVYLQPKIIPEVLLNLKNINFVDRLIYKFHPYPVYDKARKFFLEHKEYTHMILHPNDIVVTRPDLLRQIQDVEQYEYDCITGVTNVDLQAWFNFWAFCQELPEIDPEKRIYNWAQMDMTKGIRQVKHSGFQLFCMSRRILERFDIKGDELYLPHVPPGFSTDLVWSHQMANANIPIYADTRINMLHLRYRGEMMAGKVGIAPEIIFKKKGEIYP